jgi:diacylglycerol kinase (ATP)
MLEHTLQRLTAHGLQFDLHETEGPGDAEKAVRREGLDKSYDAVVAAGGDGTINEVVNGLLGTKLSLGIIPLGTVNVLALELGLLKDPERVARAIVFGPARSVNVGIANGRAFLLMMGAGFDGRVVAGVSSKLKRILGQMAYMVSGLKEIFFNRPAELVVDVDGIQYHASWAVVSNSSLYGGKYQLAPDTNLESPGFEVSLICGNTRWALIRGLLEMALNRKKKSVWKQVFPVKNVSITASREEPTQMDGDHFETLPLTITSAPQSLELIMPSSTPVGPED